MKGIKPTTDKIFVVSLTIITLMLGQLILLSSCTVLPISTSTGSTNSLSAGKETTTISASTYANTIANTASNLTESAEGVARAAGTNGIKYSYEFIGAFDTVIQLIGYAPDKAMFDRWAKTAEQQFRELHKLFDAYNTYNGINNMKTINNQAGKSPVVVDKRILELLLETRRLRSGISQAVDLTIGPVVSLWAEYRTAALEDPDQASKPTEEQLASTMLLMGADELAIDVQASTVYLPRTGMMLDVGAVGKGYATELVAQNLIDSGVTSMIINAGGSSVRMIGKPGSPERLTWNIAIQNPEVLLPSPDYIPKTAEPTLTVIRTKDTSVVTSGDYQRFYNVEDQICHHLINPEDGQPARYYRAVTVMTRDSGLADFLSTTLFLLPYKESRALVERLPDVSALWIFADGRVEMTSGMTSVADPLPDLEGLIK